MLRQCRRWPVSGVLVLFLWMIPWTAYGAEWEDLADWAESPTHPNGATYMPYPPQPAMQAPAAPSEKQPWYKKLFRPMTKQMSPPIYQADKVPKSLPKDTPVIQDPLVRLAKGLVYAGSTVEPGFYLLSFQAKTGNTPDTLILSRQQKHCLTVPIGPKTPASVATAKPANLPEPPQPDNTNPPAPTQEAPKGWVEFSADGKSAILVYQVGQQEYQSAPIAVGEAWRL